jgi:glycosyltransferase involved in cell wall biosynthesis
VVNESLHYNTPVLVTTSAGASELIQDGSNGLRIAPHDPSALASAINLVLGDKHMLAKLAHGAGAHPAGITDPAVGARPIIDAIKAAGEAK